jgi:hypothetical protein
VSVHRFRKEIERLENAMRPEPEDEAECHRRLKMVREGAEQLNESFYRDLARERRTAFLESVGYEGHAAEDLRDENFLYPGDEPPFTIAEDGMVYSTRDGKPMTDYAQTLAEVWYWQEVDQKELYLIHNEEAQAFYTPEGNLAISREQVDLRHVFYAIDVLEREIEDLSE